MLYRYYTGSSIFQAAPNHPLKTSRRIRRIFFIQAVRRYWIRGKIKSEVPLFLLMGAEELSSYNSDKVSYLFLSKTPSAHSLFYRWITPGH